MDKSRCFILISLHKNSKLTAKLKYFVNKCMLCYKQSSMDIEMYECSVLRTFNYKNIQLVQKSRFHCKWTTTRIAFKPLLLIYVQ